ncbi:MAG: hypothetical protein ACXVCP_07650 [Bdellovibrio sp.]
MKFIILISTIFLFSSAFADSQDLITIGSDNHEVLWIEQKAIKNKNIYLMGYRSPDQRQIERVIPSEIYISSIKELQDIKKSFHNKPMLSSYPFCEERIVIQHNKDKELLCLDFFEAKEKKKVIQWVAQQADFLIR